MPHHARAGRAAIERIVVRRNAWHRTRQDGLVAMPESGDADSRLLFPAARVVAGPFPERTLVDEVVSVNKSLKGDFGFGRNGQAGLRSLNDADRLAEQTTRSIVFILAVRDLDARDGKQPGMNAGNHGDRAGLTAI